MVEENFSKKENNLRALKSTRKRDFWVYHENSFYIIFAQGWQLNFEDPWTVGTAQFKIQKFINFCTILFQIILHMPPQPENAFNLKFGGKTW